MKPNLNQQLKLAQRDKYIAETKRAESEKLKIDFEFEKLKKESGKYWLFSPIFWQRIITVVIGVSFLGFYIDFVMLPISSTENKQLKLENTINSEKMHEIEVELKKTALSFRYYSDSVIMDFNQRKTEFQNIALNDSIKKVVQNNKKLSEYAAKYIIKSPSR